MSLRRRLSSRCPLPRKLLPYRRAPGKAARPSTAGRLGRPRQLASGQQNPPRRNLSPAEPTGGRVETYPCRAGHSATEPPCCWAATLLQSCTDSSGRAARLSTARLCPFLPIARHRFTSTPLAESPPLFRRRTLFALLKAGEERACRFWALRGVGKLGAARAGWARGILLGRGWPMSRHRVARYWSIFFFSVTRWRPSCRAADANWP